jgi:hypothetical protein
MPRFQEGDRLFDGFAHRPYEEKLDGWMNEVPDGGFAVKLAESILELHDRNVRLTRENFDLKRRLKQLAGYK